MHGPASSWLSYKILDRLLHIDVPIVSMYVISDGTQDYNGELQPGDG